MHLLVFAVSYDRFFVLVCCLCCRMQDHMAHFLLVLRVLHAVFMDVRLFVLRLFFFRSVLCKAWCVALTCAFCDPPPRFAVFRVSVLSRHTPGKGCDAPYDTYVQYMFPVLHSRI